MHAVLRTLCVLLLCALAWGQGGVVGPKGAFGPGGVVSPGASGGGTLITANVGQAIINPTFTDSGNGLFMSAVQFTTPTPSSGGISVTSLGVFVASPAAANWGVAIYTDSASLPSTLVTNCSTFSGSTPSTPTATLVPTSCTLSAATKYWIAAITVSNTQQQLEASHGACDTGPGVVFSNSALGSFTSVASWPSSFGASTLNAVCYGQFAAIQYTTTSTYTVASSGTAICPSGTSCTVDIVPAASGHGLVVGSQGVDLSAIGTLTTSFADSASDTITSRGTCTGTTTISLANCIGSADRATAGASTLTANYGGTALSGVMSYAEVIGTASSSSFDQSAYDTTLSASPFTSGNTGTTTQANEILFGIAGTTLATGTYTAGGSWTLLGQATTFSGNNMTGALFFKTVSATGTYNLQGSYSSAGTSNLPALATFK